MRKVCSLFQRIWKKTAGRKGGSWISHTPDFRRFQDQVEPVVENLEEVERLGHTRYDVFTDWIDLMLYSLEGDDESYLEVVETYDNSLPEGRRAVDLYAEAFAQLQKGMAETDADLLGVVYEELGMDSEAFGQYFTPHNICDAMAEMTISVIEEDFEEPYSVADPACGSGRMLIYAAKKIPGDVDAVFWGCDKDTVCAKMTALNLCFFNLDGYAVQGDSLKMESNRVWNTQRTLLGGELRELGEEEFPELHPEPADIEDEDDPGVFDRELPKHERRDDLDLDGLEELELSDFIEEDP